MGLPSPLTEVTPQLPFVNVAEAPRRFQGDRLSLRAISSTLQRRFWLYTLLFLAIFVATGVITLSQAPQYTATARVLLNARDSDVAPQGAQTQQGGGDRVKVDSEIAVLRSRELAGQVVDALNLQKDPAFASPPPPPSRLATLKTRIKTMLGRPPPPPATAASSATLSRENIIDSLLDAVAIQQVTESYALDVIAQSGDPEDAAKLANAFAEVYSRYKLNAKADDNRQANDLLSGRIDELRRQAQEDTRAVQQYRIDNNLLSTTGATLTEQQISSTNEEVTRARAQVAEDQARLETARRQLAQGSNGDDVGEALASDVVKNLRTQRIATSARVADLEGRYGPMHPDLLKAKRELSDIDLQIKQEINRTISNLVAKAAVSTQRLRSLEGSLGSARQGLQQNNRAMIQLSELENRAKTSQALYESYLERVKQTAAQDGTLRADAQIISRARVPTNPSSPRIMLNMLLGGMLGVGVGLSAAIVAEMLSSHLTTAEDVESRLGQRYLGAIPLVGTVEKAGRTPSQSIIDYPRSAYAEAFRNLRTSVAYATDRTPQVVLVTSSLPQEGKTTTSLCLAQSAATEGLRVMVIDCDLRRRSLSREIGMNLRPTGLMEVLAGDSRLEDEVTFDEVGKIYFLGANGSPKSNSELLTGREFDQLLAKLRKHFDLIVLDAAPVLPVAETRVLATRADATIFVARWEKTPEQAILSALRMLPDGKVRLAGVVLTQMDMRKQAKYGFGDAGYYYNQYKAYYG